MDTLFFLLSLTFGWLAWNLYHPIIKHEKFIAVSFLAGWLTGELALHVIFWQVLTVAFFVMIHAVDGVFGAIGFLICVASWLTMGYYYFESGAAKVQSEAGLKAGLGDNYEEEILEEFRHQFPAEPDQNLIRHPFRFRDPEVEKVKNVPFGDHGLTLDIRRAKYDHANQKRNKDQGLKPVLLQIHGGAWTENMGSKNEQGLPLMNHMAKRGWVCVANAYRLSPKATFPEHIVDCKQALVWIKDHIEEYGGDPNFIVVTGGSAGGHLSSLLAMSANHPAFQPGFEDRDTTVQGAVPFYGVYDMGNFLNAHPHEGVVGFVEDNILKLDVTTNEAAFKQASPQFHISEDAPPTLVIHGDSDSLTPVEGARLFVEALQEQSKNKVAYVELKGAQHAFDVFPSLRSEHVKHAVEKFLQWTYSQHLTGNTP